MKNDKKCSKCNGSGTVTEDCPNGCGEELNWYSNPPCPICGRDRTVEVTCSTCKGTGKER